MIYLLCVLLNVPASPAVSVQAPIPRSGLVHGVENGRQLSTRNGWIGLSAMNLATSRNCSG